MITLRTAKVEDTAALLEIYRPYVLSTAVTFETEVPAEAEFRQRILDFSARYPYLVAEENGTILGYAYAHAFHERAAYGWSAESSVYVRQDQRRSGIGARLYRGLMELLTLQGVHRCVAIITVPNDPSIAFHLSMGFQMGPVLPEAGFKLGTWYSVAYLYKELRDYPGEPESMIPFPALDRNQVKEILKKS